MDVGFGPSHRTLGFWLEVSGQDVKDYLKRSWKLWKELQSKLKCLFLYRDRLWLSSQVSFETQFNPK